jgi:hypothetical protein
MVAYLRLLPFLGLLLADGTSVAAQGVQGVSKGQKWTKESQSFFVPGAYIVEFEDENVSFCTIFHFLWHCFMVWSFDF